MEHIDNTQARWLSMWSTFWIHSCISTGHGKKKKKKVLLIGQRQQQQQQQQTHNEQCQHLVQENSSLITQCFFLFFYKLKFGANVLAAQMMALKNYDVTLICILGHLHVFTYPVKNLNIYHTDWHKFSTDVHGPQLMRPNDTDFVPEPK